MRLWNEVRQRSPAIFFGAIWESAPTMQAMTRLRISPWEPAGAGRWTFTMVAGRRDHLDRPEGALVQRRLRIEHRFHRDENPCRRYSRGRVDRKRHLGRGACEICRQAITVHLKRNWQEQRLEFTADECFEIIFVIISPVGAGFDACAHSRFRAVEVKSQRVEQRVE